ncbi:Structural maintenance of chromosome protein SMC5/Spr18, SMC superfamily [Trachipleistophora hominis]|uniref:Structural maintenance of chromosomes protein 5 n=1 Tax=Trachipleistophora hominis TaxID=72359 RepID=L7JZS1_TRAHO|nr:Structural maintenance of chromosome protein SMC5/Spr18, SMC superfamily [Trachipleistophora hominis]
MYEEFRDGSIISLQLHNFQTYSDVKFDFHPRLNFIAGPNGSGKSTIANAIAFIFGGSTKVLSKAKDLMDFIKFDTNDSYIEIKIKYTGKVTTIRRALVPLKNSSLWFLNGCSTPYIKIQQMYNELKININNICNYLPQEKVAEFTRFSPEELFRTFIETYHEQNIVDKINTLIDMEGFYDSLSGDLEKILCNKMAIEKVISGMSRDIEKVKEKKRRRKG